MCEELQKIPFCLALLRIKFFTQNSVDLLISPSVIDEFPNPCRDRILQSIEPADFRPGLFDGHNQDHPVDQSPGNQRIFFETSVDKVLQLVILVYPALRPVARLA